MVAVFVVDWATNNRFEDSLDFSNAVLDVLIAGASIRSSLFELLGIDDKVDFENKVLAHRLVHTSFISGLAFVVYEYF